MCLQSRRSLLQGSNRQALGRAKAQIVGLIPDLPMSSPGSPGEALDLPMSRQAPVFSHKAKRRQRCQPGKPLRAVRLQGEQTVLRTDDHVAAVGAILDQR